MSKDQMIAELNELHRPARNVKWEYVPESLIRKLHELLKQQKDGKAKK